MIITRKNTGLRRCAKVVFRAFAALAAGFGMLGIVLSTAEASSRIKDIVTIEGIRDNMLVGYGLVVGLNNTGDSLTDGHFTKQSLLAMLDRLGVKPTESVLDSENVAAVMVTAVLPPFSRQGNRIDVTVSALGDAESLLGGTLLVTPLLGADGEVYAVAQGQLAVGGFTAVGTAETITKGVPTSARIANGAIVEREVGFEIGNMETVKINLRNPDFDHRAAHLAGHQRVSRHRRGAAERSGDRAAAGAERLRQSGGQPSHRHRAVAHRA